MDDLLFNFANSAPTTKNSKSNNSANKGKGKQRQSQSQGNASNSRQQQQQVSAWECGKEKGCGERVEGIGMDTLEKRKREGGERQ